VRKGPYDDDDAYDIADDLRHLQNAVEFEVLPELADAQDAHDLDAFNKLDILEVVLGQLAERDRREHVDVEGEASDIPRRDQFPVHYLIVVLVEIRRPEIQDDIDPEADDRKVIEPVDVSVVVVFLEKAHDNGEKDRVDDDEDHHEKVPERFEHPLAADHQKWVLDLVPLKPIVSQSGATI
jgi:hypothetical protein